MDRRLDRLEDRLRAVNGALRLRVVRREQGEVNTEPALERSGPEALRLRWGKREIVVPER
jgi:hypothetical protein